ncbi:GntR family transcriptional regulator [Paenibacillus chitinolyticus]|uniref:GntR family transcriptional regulator n=1 Tax=Paenibacillus chitinolyticus TaxID=79263 RepID=A0A410WQ36_9BACL|nr:GntR family transcriptional regulator [Paenibacillus chitinolyticus]MCY9591024.1 GntR family transcriptional regulator [Paenibacillus chitinolyticus]MCY9597175.1 GntR family transcriptional regulator [Paenibacillus chitinolyticus]QAV16454.1 GntR family transcriptional regulator [Paenibacillus chitinolyticus]
MEVKPEHPAKAKKPLYLTVYNELFKKIMSGVFPSNSQLPTEPELAKMFDVSRMTLRQALALLQDDGLVKSIHGKGNFVTPSRMVQRNDGLDKIGNPIYKCHTEDIDHVDIQFRLDLESDYTKEVLKRKATAVVAVERWYMSKGQAVAFGFTFMAIEAVTELNLDLQNEEQLLDMLENKIYELANSATVEVKHSTVMNTSSQKFELDADEGCDLLLESLYVNEQYPIVYNKYYIPKEFSRIVINASKK